MSRMTFKIKKDFFCLSNLAIGLSVILFISGIVLYSIRNAGFLSLHYNPPSNSLIFFLFFLTFIFYLVFLLFVTKNILSFSKIIKKTLLFFLPAEIVTLISLHYSSKYIVIPMRNGLAIFASLYLLTIGFYLLFRYKNYRKISDFFREFYKKPLEKRSFPAGLLILAIMAINLAFGLYHLGTFAAVDEPLWTQDRIPKFWSNVSEKEFGKTSVSDKPGITVAILSGFGLLKVNPHYYKNGNWEGIKTGDLLDIKNMNFIMRLPIFLFNCLMLIAFYFLVKRVFGKTAALFSVIFIGLSPILIGISSIINPDSLLWTFAPLSLLAYMAYLKTDLNKYLYYCGVLLGLAILTKYVANILYVYFLIIIFLHYLLDKKRYEGISFKKYFQRAIGDYLVVIFFSLATFLVLLPAAWVNITNLLDGTLYSKAFINIWPFFIGLIALIFLDLGLNRSRVMNRLISVFGKIQKYLVIAVLAIFLLSIIFVFINVYTGMKFFDLESILASPKSSHNIADLGGIWLANFYSLVYGVNPLALLSTVFISAYYLVRIKKKDDSEFNWAIILILFILFYYSASVVESVSATVRYQIVLYPLIFILGALGLSKLYDLKKNFLKNKYFLPVLYLTVIILCVYSLNFIKPFFFSYASDFLPKKYVLNLKDMGDGSYEAADYLNKIPDAQNFAIWTDKKGVCTFFAGNCLSGFDLKPLEIQSIRYYVVSSGREVRTNRMSHSKSPGQVNFGKIYDEDDSDWKLEIGGRPNNFVKIVSASKVNN